MTPTLTYNFCGNNSEHKQKYSKNYLKVLPSNIDILHNIPNNIQDLVKKDLFDAVICFLNCFQELIVAINDNHPIDNSLPPLHFSLLDDEAIFIEWIFPFFRIGFSIEENIEDSSWFLVTNRQFQERTESGLINPNQPQEILNRLINFAINYS